MPNMPLLTLSGHSRRCGRKSLIAIVDLEIRSFARSLAPLAKDAAFVNRMVLSYAVPVALLVGTVVRSSQWEFSSP
jgi:hypothetical protein